MKTLCSSLTIRGIITVISLGCFLDNAPGLLQGNSLAAQDRPFAGSSEQESLKTGNDFRKALKASTSVTWQAVPLRRGLTNLAASQSISIFLDRRVDPGFRTNFVVKDKPLGYVLYKLADQLDLAVCFEANIVYIGPRESVDRLPTLLAYQQQKISRFDAETKNRLRKTAEVQWEMLVEPKELIGSVADLFGFGNTNTEVVPHDVWYQGRLPSGRADQQLTVLLNGFDLMIVISRDGRSLKIVEIPDSVEPTIEYGVSAADVRKAKTVEKDFPKAEYSASTRKLSLTGTFADHAKVYRIFNPIPEDTSTDSSTAKKVYDLSIKAPSGNVLASVAKMLDRKLKYDPSLQVVLSEQVTIDAKSAPVEELLRQALEPLDLEYRIEEKTLTIIRKD